MNKTISHKKNELFKESILLREEAGKIDNFDKSMNVRKKQDDVYKRYQFYTNMIKANDKIKNK